MSDYYYKEQICGQVFAEAGEMYHLWTPENNEILFACEEDYMHAMGVMAIAQKEFPDIRTVTYQIMSNHLHSGIFGKMERILLMFDEVKRMVDQYLRMKGRVVNLKDFKAEIRLVKTVDESRNVITYINRNGFLVSKQYTPYSYPWGANGYYFNEPAVKLAIEHAKVMGTREKRMICRTHGADSIKDILTYNGYALPLSFCDIKLGESLFHGASHYFSKISRNVEGWKTIAKDIGESVFYTDDELYAVVSKLAKDINPSLAAKLLNVEDKISLAKTMSYEYNASTKQICRMLKLDPSIVNSLGL